MLTQRLRVPELGRSEAHHSWRSMKIERVRPDIRIPKCAPGLASEKVLILAEKMAHVWYISPNAAVKVVFHHSLENVVSQRLPEFGGEP